MEKDNDDGFVMNIMGSAPSTKKSFISQNEKRKNKKEKFMEKRMLHNKRKREMSNKKKEQYISKPYRPNDNKKEIYNTKAEDNTIKKEEDNANQEEKKEEEIEQEIPIKKEKKKLTFKQKTEQQLHREQLTEEIKQEMSKITESKEEDQNEDNKEINVIKSSDDTQDKPKEQKVNNAQSVFSIRSFSDLKISEYLKRSLAKHNYETMTKVQKKSIPILLEHKNVVVKSETGSGKTLAYVIPLYEQLININKESKINRKQGVYSIIFSPTHELCMQIEETFNKLKSSCINVVFGSLMGGQKMDTEKLKLRKGLNVIITTPGRLLYHLKNTKGIDFTPLKTIIFDEADLLLNMGFERDIKECLREIIKKELPPDDERIKEEFELNPDMFKKYKIFLISATIDNKIRKLSNYLMKGFKAVGFEQKTNKDDEEEENEIIHAASGLNQYYTFVHDEFRLINLIAFLYNNINSKVIIFVSTCDAVEFLQKLLTEIDIDPLYEIESSKPKSKHQPQSQPVSSNNKIKLISQTIYKLHGKMKHDERKEIFSQFNKNKLGILISTDVAARGLDFPQVDWVIHYDVNPDIKEYVNRMGRTARLDHIGNSLIFLMQNEQVLLSTCFKGIKDKIKEIISSDILLQFVNKINKNILKHPIEMKPMPFDKEVDENEKFRKKYIFSILPIQRVIRDFIFADRDNLALARKAFKSEVRSYVTFMRYQKEVFNVKALNLTRISRSFGLYKESMKMKVGNSEVVVDHEYEKTNVKAERKYMNKKIQNKLMYSEFE